MMPDSDGLMLCHYGTTAVVMAAVSLVLLLLYTAIYRCQFVAADFGAAAPSAVSSATAAGCQYRSFTNN